jgi:Lrp/AsnC family leucine-responsive transcriptional regulator
MISLSRTDRRLLKVLQRDARIAFADLAQEVGLSTSACWRKVRQLEADGVIQGYRAQINPRAVGISFDAFLSVSIDLNQTAAFETVIASFDEVVGCYAITGEKDYLLHAMFPDVEAFDHFVRHKLGSLSSIENITSSLAFHTVKRERDIPLETG